MTPWKQPEQTHHQLQRFQHIVVGRWLPKEGDQSDNILVFTTRRSSAQTLQNYFQQNGKQANAETAVKVAGATARHCIILHGRSNFLSGSGRQDFDNECYTGANVAYSRATDLTVLACPVNMHGIPGALQVLAAPLHGVCTIHTGSKCQGKLDRLVTLC